MRVLLLGAGGSAGENFTRAVQSRRVHVVGVDTDANGLALSTARTCRHIKTSPADGAAHLRTINDLVHMLAIDVVHAQPDPEIAFLAQHADKIDAATLVPAPEAMRIAQDKLLTADAAFHVAPPTMAVDTPKDLMVALTTLGSPVWLRLRRGAGSMGALAVRAFPLGHEWIEHWDAGRGLGYGHWVAHQYLPGRHLSWTGVFRNGRILASAAKERVVLAGASRAASGVSSTATVQRIIVDIRVNDVARHAVGAVSQGHADGVFMVDMREDASGYPRVTEINAGRFGTTCDLWAEAGCNLPLIYLEAALGKVGPRQIDACRAITHVRQMDMGSTFLAA